MAAKSNASLPPTQLMLDTRHAITLSDNGSTAQFNIVDGIDTQVEIQSVNLQLLQFQASHSIYNITEANNTLEFYTTYTDGTSSTYILKIPNGHYSLDYLRTYLNDQLSSGEFHFQPKPTPAPDTFTIMDKYSTCEFTGLITFQLPACIITPAIQTVKKYSGFYLLIDKYPGLPKTLGFYSDNSASFLTIGSRLGVGVAVTSTAKTEDGITKQIYAFSSMKNDLFSITNSGYLVSAKFLDLSYPRNIYIVIDGLNTNNRCSLVENSYGTILEKVPLQSSKFGDNIYYEPYLDFPQLLPNFHVNTIKIRTLDENGQTIDWNNGYWSITIGITWSIDLGSSGLEDTTAGRHFRPILHSTEHDPLLTQREHKRRR